MSTITDFLPQYRELNALFANAADSGKVGYAEQHAITDFWNEHRDIKLFEKMVLDIVLDKDKSTWELLLSGVRSEVERNIGLYESSKDILDGIDTAQVCKEVANRYNGYIQSQTEVVNEYSRELTKINGSLDAIGFRKHIPQEIERLEQQHDYLTKRYSEEKEKLTELYDLQKQSSEEAAKCRENLFGKIHSLSLDFQRIINCYLIAEASTEDTITLPEPEPETIKVQEIDPDTIFRAKMFDKLLLLEQKLIDSKYLSPELHWVSTHENGKADIKRLIIFLTGLAENNYFLPNRDPKIKALFEARYHISIGQNFERSRRKQYVGEYKMVFYDYPF